MRHKVGIGVVAVLGLIAMALGVTACAAGVSQKDYDAVKAEATSLKQQLEAAKTGGQQAGDLQKQLADLKKRAAWSINTDAKPNPPPAPPPPGATPAPPPQPPAARTVPIAFYVDTVTAAAGESKYKIDATYGCMRTSLFKRGQRIVWRMEITDTSTGKVLQAADVEKTTIKLPNGETLNLAFGRHGRTDDSPWFWAAGWDVPPDYPLGRLNYTIEVVTKDGKTGSFKEMTLAPSMVELLQTTRPDPDKWKMTDAGLLIVD